MVAVYAPTEVSEEEDKNLFYDKLAKICDGINKHVLMVLGDLNVKLGREPFVSQVTKMH